MLSAKDWLEKVLRWRVAFLSVSARRRRGNWRIAGLQRRALVSIGAVGVQLLDGVFGGGLIVREGRGDDEGAIDEQPDLIQPFAWLDHRDANNTASLP